MRPQTFGQTAYYYDYIDRKGVAHRDLSLYQAARAGRPGQWCLVEARAVYHIDGHLVWFEHLLAQYNSGDVSYKAIRSLAQYLNKTDALVDYLDQRHYKDGGVSICHKRRIISPDAINYPGTGFPLIKDEVLSHIRSKTAMEPKIFNKTYADMELLVDRYNKERINSYQIAYYQNQLDSDSSNSERIESEIKRLSGVVEVEEKRELTVVDKQRRMARSMRSIGRLS